MYQILGGELVKKGLAIHELADMIGISERTLRNKMKGKTEFTWTEVCKIHSIVNSKMSKDELFFRKNI